MRRGLSTSIVIIQLGLVLIFGCDKNPSESDVHANVVQVGDLHKTMISNPGDSTYFRFNGLVRNEGDLTALNVNVLIICYDIQGGILDTLDCYRYYDPPDSILEIGALSPGEISPFVYPSFASPPSPYWGCEEILIYWTE